MIHAISRNGATIDAVHPDFDGDYSAVYATELLANAAPQCRYAPPAHHAAILPGFSGKLSKSERETGTPRAKRASVMRIRHDAGTPRPACRHFLRFS